MLKATTFTFSTYEVDAERSTITFTYKVRFAFGLTKTFKDRLLFKDVPKDAWSRVPPVVLEPTLQALHIMLGINYWCVFRTKNIRIEGYSLTREQARFWDTVYLHGLAEYFYLAKIDFRGLISFPFDEHAVAPAPQQLPLPVKSLLLNGAGKDSILSAEMLKEAGAAFDFFSFSPTPAHRRIAKLVGATTVSVERRYDPWLRQIGIGAYPSVSTFTFIATLLAELLGYDTILFSNERSADIGNFTYLGIEVNHQWCKSSEAEKLINDYIQAYITPSIATRSLLRSYSELEIVRRFARYPRYLMDVTSCNSYFWLSRLEQSLAPPNYWCKRCPKCVFLFACFSAYLPKETVIGMFGADLYDNERLLPLFKSILGIEGFKPLDCVGEPEEMILAMEYARRGGKYAGEPAMRLFEERFPETHDFAALESKVFSETAAASDQDFPFAKVRPLGRRSDDSVSEDVLA